MIKKFLTILGFLMGFLLYGATVTQAITILPTQQGGTGWGYPGQIFHGAIIFGNYGGSQLATSTNLTFATSTNLFSTTYASTTAVSAISFCLTGDICRTTWPSGGSGASTTLLGDSNTFSGALDIFSNTIKVASLSGLIGGNSGTLYGFASSSLFGYTPLNPTRNINTTYPVTGGGDLSADRTIALAFGTTTSNTWANTQTFTNPLVDGSLNGLIGGNSGTTYAFASSSLFGYTPLNPTRNINTSAPLGGGGNLSSDLTITCASCATFAYPFPAGATTTLVTFTNATSTLFTATTAWLGTLGKALNGGGFQINNIAAPTSGGDAANKTYVDNAISGVNPAVAVSAATTQASDTSGLTYNNGASGIAATFTGSNNTAITIDGYTFTALNQRLLVKNDTQSPSGAFNGIYYVTQVQTAILPPILTRALDYDQPSDINSTGAIPVVNGTVNANTSWLITSTVNTVGTDPLTYVQFSLAPSTIVTTSRNINTTYPLQGGGNLSADRTLTTSFGTTTNNGMSQGVLYSGSGGVWQTAASSSIFGFTPISGNQTITLTGAVTGSGATAITTAFGNAGANTVLANGTGATAVPTFTATSSLFQNASASASGLLTSTDWSTFNSKQTALAATWPQILSGSTLSFGGLSTSTPAILGNIPYFSGVNTFANVATGSVSSGTGISVTAGQSVIGSGLTITNSGVTSNVAGTGISVSGGTGAVTITNTGVTSLTAGTGISLSGSTGAVTITNTGGSSFGYPFPSNATSTVISFTSGINASSTSNIWALNLGSSTLQSYTNAPLVITGNVNSFTQSVLTNLNSGNAASADYVIGNNLSTNSSYFGDFGINSSTYSQAGFTGEAPNDVFLQASDSNLDLEAASTTGAFGINFLTGGLNSANIRFSISNTGQLTIATTTAGCLNTSATGVLYAATCTGGAGTGGIGTTTVTGTINDANTAFTVSVCPALLNINGGMYAQTGGAYTWTCTVPNITLSAAVGTGGSIFGIVGTTTTAVIPGSVGQFDIFTGTNTVSGTSSIFVSAASLIGVGTTSPFAQLSVSLLNPTNGSTTLFAVASSSTNSLNASLFTVLAGGQITLSEQRPATSTTMVLDWSATARQVNYRIGGSATTITLINATTSQFVGSTKIVWVCNPTGFAGGVLTWAGVEWVGTAPTQTTTANQCDVYSFDITSGTSTTASPAYKVAGSAGTGFQ